MSVMGESMALWASGLGVRHKRRWIFRDLALALHAGEIVRISGDRGSGKSTLLRVLAGVLKPSAGIVRHRPPIIGYVPPRFPAPQSVSAEQYLTEQARLRGLPARAAYLRAESVIDRMGLRGVVDLPATELSSEDLRGLSFAQALLDRPSLLVVDDPWHELSSVARATATSEIEALSEAGCVVVLTDRSHQLQKLRVDEHLSLAGGILFPLSRELAESTEDLPAAVRVELYGAGTALEQSAGILDLRVHPDGLTVIVERDRTNELLRLALQGGWLIRRVEPSP
jgi:ABC-type multidrug transport system ATPase subunit